MAKGKITLLMLSEMMANNSGRSKAATELFVRTFFTTLKDALQRDNIIKIKGFGTFKMVVVNARESVNVNTGKRVSISEYNKITFTPDKTLKDRINRPFSQFDTIVIDDADVDMIEGRGDDTSSATTSKNVDDISVETKVEPIVGEELLQPKEDIVESNFNSETPLAVVPISEEKIVETETGTKAETESAETTEDIISDENVEDNVESVFEPEVSLEDGNDNDIQETINEEHVFEQVEEHVLPDEEQSDTNIEKTPIVSRKTTDLRSPQKYHDDDKTKESTTFKKAWLWVLLLIVVCGTIYVILNTDVLDYINGKQKDNEANTETLLEADTIPSNNSLEGEDEARMAYEVGLDSIKKQKEAIAEYPQIDDGKYYIVGVKTYRKIKPGYDIKKYCMQIYGKAECMPYILLMNNLPDAKVSIGKVIKFPELLEK